MLTPQQIQQIKTSTATPQFASNPEQAKAMFSATPQSSTPSYLQRVGSDIKSNVSQAGQDIENPQSNAFSSGLSAVSHIASAVASPLTEAPGVKQFGNVVNKSIDFAGDKLSNLYSDKFKQELSNMTPEQYKSATQPLQDMANSGNIANTILMAKGVQEGVKNIADKAPGIVNNIADKAKGMVTKDSTPANIESNASKAHSAIDTEVRNTAAKYPSVGKVLNESEVNHGTTPVKVLSSYPKGEALPTLIKGKLQVDNATNFLKTQISKLGEMKKNLVATGKEVVPIDTLKSDSLSKIDNMNWSEAKKATMKEEVGRIIDTNIKTSYPNGVPNTEMDLLKTENAGESKAYAGRTSPFSLDAHGIIADAAKSSVERVGGTAPIEELNKVISSHYDAIKLLNSMRGKTPHGGVMSKMFNNTIGEVAGLGAGMTVGHPFLGAMAGRAGADAINEIINNHFISNPLKRSLVTNMKGVDPEVIQKATDYLNSQSVKSTNSSIPSNPKALKLTSPKSTTTSLKVKGETPPTKLDPTKYKSADEFIQAQPVTKKVVGYRYGSDEGQVGAGTFYNLESGVDKVPEGQIYKFKNEKKKNLEFRNPLILKDKEVSTGGSFEYNPADFLAKKWGLSDEGVNAEINVAKEANKRGYDAVIYGDNEIQDLSQMNKSQLTDIWKKANKK